MTQPLPRVLFLSTINPVRCDTGKAVVVHGFAEYLFNAIGADNFLFASLENIEPAPRWPWVHVDGGSRFKKIFSALTYSIALQTKSLQESFYFSKKINKQIIDLINNFKPDIVIYDTIRLGQYITESPKSFKSILYFEDLLSFRYERIINFASNGYLKHLNPLGNFGRHLPVFLQRWVTDSPWLQIQLLHFERRLVERSEVKQAKLADFSLLISIDEALLLQQKVLDACISDIPPFLTRDFKSNRSWSGNPEFVFLGSLNLAHNIVGLMEFLKHVFPIVLKKIPDVSIRIIGRHAPPELIALRDRHPKNISIEGYVDNIDSILSNACALIAPLIFGSGVKLKIIDSLAYGTPIVATGIGVEGVNFKSGVHGIVCNSVDEFPLAMENLLDKDNNMLYSKNCLDLFHRVYSKDSIINSYNHKLLLNQSMSVK